MKRQEIKPAEGASVLNPKTGQPLKEKGERVIWGSYWDRRLAEGSIVLVKGSLKNAIDKQQKVKTALAEKEAKAKKAGAKNASEEG